MRLCLYFCQKSERGGSYSKIYKDRRLKSIGKTLFRVLVDCVVQKIFECLFASVDLMWLFKFVMFAIVIRAGSQVAGCLPVVLFVLWLLFI